MMSRKKRDSCLSVAGTGNNPAPTGTVSTREIRMLPTTTSTYHPSVHVLAYCPTHRWLQPNNADYAAQRTSTRPFYKGFAENYDIQTNDGSMWVWRRIAFSTKDITVIPPVVRATLAAQATAVSSSNRVMRDLSGEATGNYQQALTNIYALIFKGIDQTDWVDPLTARTDNTRCTIISDRKRSIRSGNAAGVNRLVKTYIPINKTLVYDDEENGQSMTPAAQTVGSKQGMGDMYIVDFFVCGAPVDPAGSVLSVSSSSTTYWHEK